MKENMLFNYGYHAFFCEEASPFTQQGLTPARIIAEHKSQYLAATEFGEMPGVLAGSFRHALEGAAGMAEALSRPTVGDYVMAKISNEKDRAVIQSILPRKTSFVRKDAWSAAGAQILGANFDTVFICMSLNKNFNIGRLERYLVLAGESGAQAAVVLTKADLCSDVEMQMEITQAVCGDVPVHAVSAKDGMGIDKLAPYFAQGKTVVALGSSGVGKSSLVNSIFGETIMDVKEIRDDDDMGRHTTVHRQIILLPSGGLYMDTPGLREVGLVDAAESISAMYGDVEEAIAQCRFNNCTHKKEPGCAVQKAIRVGTLTESQFEKYLKFKKESAFLVSKEQRKARAQNSGLKNKKTEAKQSYTTV